MGDKPQVEDWRVVYYGVYSNCCKREAGKQGARCWAQYDRDVLNDNGKLLLGFAEENKARKP